MCCSILNPVIEGKIHVVISFRNGPIMSAVDVHNTISCIILHHSSTAIRHAVIGKLGRSEHWLEMISKLSSHETQGAHYLNSTKMLFTVSVKFDRMVDLNVQEPLVKRRERKFRSARAGGRKRARTWEDHLIRISFDWQITFSKRNIILSGLS